MHSEIGIHAHVARRLKPAQQKLLELRALIIEVAQDCDITDLTKTPKWGEPAYTRNAGSTLRIDHKEKPPDCIQPLFHCQSKLGDVFSALFGDELSIVNNRAKLLPLDKALPAAALKACVGMALNYHNLKHLTLLGYDTPQEK